MTAPALEIIAEAGVNHNGDLEMALDLVDAAAEAGADLVKFQTFSAERLVSATAGLADYQKARLGDGLSQREMLARLELSETAHLRLVERCEARGIGFLSTPFDLGSLDFLTGTLGLGRIKLGSGDLTNAPILYAAARRGCEVILSTGMAFLGEIELALGLLALGYSDDPPTAPSRHDMLRAWADPPLRARLQEKVVLLHCVSNYPASAASTNLAALGTLRQAFGLRVGYSDHTLGGVAAISAVALGAAMVEKHLTLDTTLPGPDHAASSPPGELTRIIAQMREARDMLGAPVKACTPEEWSTAGVARKAIVAASPIAAGTELRYEHLTTKRAEGGGDPFTLWELLGRTTSRAYERDEPLGQVV